ncbi:MAG TPA: hypothetical protein VHD84_01105 [Candidatus Saccharimonadales bacterium]|nr:hypothetical protein [Candidatus Saccharimonadales bacterium]
MNTGQKFNALSSEWEEPELDASPQGQPELDPPVGEVRPLVPVITSTGLRVYYADEIPSTPEAG